MPFKVKVDDGEVLKCFQDHEAAEKYLTNLCKKRHGEMVSKDVARINFGCPVPWIRTVRIHEVKHTWTLCKDSEAPQRAFT